LRVGETLFNEEVIFTDPGLFEIFSFPILAGHPASVLADPVKAIRYE
jgi:hypothetical protein